MSTIKIEVDDTGTSLRTYAVLPKNQAVFMPIAWPVLGGLPADGAIRMGWIISGGLGDQGQHGGHAMLIGVFGQNPLSGPMGHLLS